jgi:cyanate lyase
MTSAMTRAELTEKLLGIKRENGWSWKHICAEIGDMSPMLITGAVLGQWKLTKPQAANAAELFGLSKTEQALLNEVPHRGSPMPPTDPLIYRFYELVMVNGPALKVLIEEEFGDGITVGDRFRSDDGTPARSQRRSRQNLDVREIPAVQILRRERQCADLRLSGRIAHQWSKLVQAPVIPTPAGIQRRPHN